MKKLRIITKLDNFCKNIISLDYKLNIKLFELLISDLFEYDNVLAIDDLTFGFNENGKIQNNLDRKIK